MERHLPKLMGWFRERATYPKINLISARDFDNRIPTGGTEMSNTISSNNSIYIKLGREDHYNN